MRVPDQGRYNPIILQSLNPNPQSASNDVIPTTQQKNRCSLKDIGEIKEKYFMKFHHYFVILIVFSVAVANCYGQSANNFTVTAYYFGGPEKVDSLAVEKLTHIIFSFCHLTGNKLTVDDRKILSQSKNWSRPKKEINH